MSDFIKACEIKNTIIADARIMVANYVLGTDSNVKFLLESPEFGADSAGRVITIVKGYGKRDGFSGILSGIFYRIWNSVKFMFSHSDWQLSKKI